MILEYLQIPFDYEHLRKLLKTEYFGSFFRNLEYLRSVGVYVQLGLGTLEDLSDPLESGLPLIAYVETGELTSYWNESTNHAVVVIGFDEQHVIVNDPFFTISPQVIPINEFALAWDAQKGLFAVLSLAPFELGSSVTSL